MYFVTFRTADSVPQTKLSAWREERETWLKYHQEPWSEHEAREYYQRFSARMDAWLDAGMGDCPMREYGASEIVAHALKFFDGNRYDLGEWVMMPNHVHAVCAPLEGYELSEILHSWKSYTSNNINALLGKEGKLWQEESFNQILRSPEHLYNVECYIRRNPEKARIRVHHASFLEGEAK